MITRYRCLFLFILFCALNSIAFADGIIIPRPIPEMPVPPNLIIKYHRVNVTIDNQTATTTVDQVFVNDINRDLEGEYIFPLPEGTALSSFAMEVDGKMVEGKILDKEKAREIYEDIVRKRKDPALLEYIGRNTVRARVFPIPAKGSKRIKLKYSEMLTADNGVVRYIYPLDTERFSPKPLEEVTLTIRINSKIPIKAFYSPSHKMAITRVDDHTIKASYEKSNYTPNTDFILYYTLSDKDFGLNMLTYREKGAKEGFFLMFLAPREETKKTEVLPKDVVFVLDRSGSMDEDKKMENAKKALNFCLSNLNPRDRFNVLAFSDEVIAFSSKGLVPATKENVQNARQFVLDKITPMGGTDIESALLRGLSSFGESVNARYLIFITDGLPTVGNTEVSDILKKVNTKNTSRVRIFTFGVGNDVNTHLLDGIAGKNRGYPEYIRKGEEMETKISGFYQKISEPLLSDVELKITGIETFSIYPKELPDIFKGSQLVLVGKYKGAGPSVIKLLGNRGKVAYNNTYEGHFPDVDEKNDFIPRLWAIRRVGYLLEAIRTGGENKELVNEVISLARQYGIITPYTSFLVTEPEVKLLPNGTGSGPAPVMAEAPPEGILRNGARRESGEEAVNASKDISDYKKADTPTEHFSSKGVDEEEKVRNVFDKTFYLRNGFWTDSEYKGDEQITRIKFASEEYFELIRDTKMARYLSLGQKVVVKYKGKVYLIE